MPRISPYLSGTVFFLYELNADPNVKTQFVGPLGSGVIIGIHDTSPPITHHYYAVTARHVVKGGASNIRINTRDGSHRFIELDPLDWTSRAGWEDIAVADITERITAETDAVYAVPSNMLAHELFRSDVGLNVGDDGFMLGLFTAHTGAKQNLIAARFGNISLLPDENAKITRKDKAEEFKSACFVFDIHSRPGFSGSPVFAYRVPENDIRDIENRTRGWRAIIRNPILSRGRIRDSDWDVEIIDETRHDNRFLRLIGIHASQFHDRVKTKKGAAKKADPNTSEVIEIEHNDDLVRSGDTISFPGSMTVVVPIWRVFDLLEDENLKEKRMARWNKAKDESDNSASTIEPESASHSEADATEPATDNPDHKEDFMSLLTEAAKVRSPKDRT